MSNRTSPYGSERAAARGATQRILVLGAGYAGLSAAIGLARRVERHDARITLINERPHFVERVRLHQVVAGQTLRERQLASILDGTGVELVIGRVTRIHPGHVAVSVGETSQRLEYDRLIYALGSGGVTREVPGVAAHARFVNTPCAAGRARDDIAALRAGTLLVVGAGLTGIETAAEIAAARPDLTIHRCAPTETGTWLTDAARRHLRRAEERSDVRTHLGRVERLTETAAILSDGRELRADITLWATGFAVPSLAREAGITVDSAGRIVVDRTLRSVSHPGIHVVGDAAAAPGGRGDAITRMSCQTAIPMGRHVADSIARELAGRSARPYRVRYVCQNISLGRSDGVIQFTRADDRPVHFVMTGLPAAWMKERVCRAAARMAMGSA